MLEFGLHQGSSLYGRAVQDALRLIPIVSVPGNHSLEVLWAICMQLQGLGYPCVVLDGSTRESSESPGLIDLLEHNHWVDAPMETSPSSAQSLAVLPAARGLAALAPRERTSAAPLHSLRPLLHRYAVVVLYAAMPALAASLMVGSSASPLLLLENSDDAVMRAYKDLKWLALETGFTGTVVSMAHGQAQRNEAHQQLRVLCDCADKHLHLAPRTLMLDPERPADLQRLALELLENSQAFTPEGAFTALPSSRGAAHAAHFPPSH